MEIVVDVVDEHRRRARDAAADRDRRNRTLRVQPRNEHVDLQLAHHAHGRAGCPNQLTLARGIDDRAYWGCEAGSHGGPSDVWEPTHYGWTGARRPSGWSARLLRCCSCPRQVGEGNLLCGRLITGATDAHVTPGIRPPKSIRIPPRNGGGTPSIRGPIRGCLARSNEESRG